MIKLIIAIDKIYTCNLVKLESNMFLEIVYVNSVLVRINPVSY